MLALLPSGAETLVVFGEVAEPTSTVEEAVVEVKAFSINRGDTFLLERPRRGWRPGKDALRSPRVRGNADLCVSSS
jgi:NADPH:quinone reductase